MKKSQYVQQYREMAETVLSASKENGGTDENFIEAMVIALIATNDSAVENCAELSDTAATATGNPHFLQLSKTMRRLKGDI